MAALSKYYSEIMKNHNVTCAYVLHPDTSCSFFLAKTFVTTILRVSQFFVPLYFLPMLANYKNLSKEKVFEVLDVFVSSVLTGGATVYVAFLMICFYRESGLFKNLCLLTTESRCTHLNDNLFTSESRNMFGGTSFWKLIPIPAAVGGLTIFFANDKVRSFFCHSVAMVVFELLVRDGSLWPLRMLRTYKSLRTLLFMIISGVVVDSMYLNSDSVFWLFKPLKKYQKPRNNRSNPVKSSEMHPICHHKNTCESHITQVFKTYLILGVILEILKPIFSNFSSILSNPIAGLFHAIKHIKPNFLLFISGYPTLTNVTNCLLNRWLQKSTRLNQNVSAVIGALPFYFCADELSLISHTFITALETIWTRYKKYSDPNTKTYQWLMKIPIAKLVYIFGGSYMYTTRLFFPWLAPKFLQRLMMLITDNKFDIIGERVHSIWIPSVIN